jgi:hypothetical protein
MSAIQILPPVNPDKIPRVVHKSLSVPVVPLPKMPSHMPAVVPTLPAGKAPKTHIPIGFTRPILSSKMADIPRAYLG